MKSIRLDVHDLMGVRDAEVELIPGKIVEVIGGNAAGKSSVAVAAQAVAASLINPLGVSVSEVGRSYLRDDNAEGHATLCRDGTELVRWTPHSGTMDSRGQDPISSPECVGTVDFTGRMPAKQRATIFQSMLLPPKSDILREVETHLSDLLEVRDLSGVLTMLEETEWGAVETIFADRGREAKRRWRETTKCNYGVRVAADWHPADWSADYDSLSVAEAEAAVTTARDALSVLHRVQAISEAEAEAAEAERRRIPGLEESLKGLEGPIRANRERLNELESRLGSTRDKHSSIRAKIAHAGEGGARVGGPSSPCPACGEPILVRSTGELVLWTPEQRKQHERIADERHAHVEDLKRTERGWSQRIKDLKSEIHSENAITRRDNNAAQNCRSELVRTRKIASRTGQVQTEQHRIDLAVHEEQVEAARRGRGMIRDYRQARGLHETIAKYTAIAMALGPRGIRAQLVEKGLARLNGGLRTIARVSGWPVVTVTGNGSVTQVVATQRQPRVIQMCSESERWRAQAAIQITLAAMTGSRLVVLDRADLLSRENRKGLELVLELVLAKCPMSVLLCSTARPGLTAPSNAPPWPQVVIRDGSTGT